MALYFDYEAWCAGFYSPTFTIDGHVFRSVIYSPPGGAGLPCRRKTRRLLLAPTEWQEGCARGGRPSAFRRRVEVQFSSRPFR